MSAAIVDELSSALAALLAPEPARAISLGAPGFHVGIPDVVYHRRELGVASKSALDKVKQSAAHYHAWLTGEDEDTPAMRFGRAFHTAALEPQKYAPRSNTKKDRDDAEAIAGMVESIKRHEIAGSLLRGALSTRGTEVTLVWEAAGVPCKGRLDAYLLDSPLGRCAFDLKSTSDASPEAFARSVANYGYDRQEAFYSDGCAALGEPLDAFIFIAVEKVPPYAVAVYQLPATWVESGRRSIARDIQTLATCCASGEFPGYSNEIVTLEPPRWALELP